MKPNVKMIVAIGLLLLMAFGNLASAYGGITVIVEPGMDEATVALANKTVSSFNDIIKKEMNVTLSRNVQLYLCPNEESFIRVLRKKFKLSKKEADFQARYALGISRDDLAVTAVNFSPALGSAAKYRALNVTAHELAHQLQADLSGNYAGLNLRWMREGTADLIAAMVGSNCGYESFEKWKLDRINDFRFFEKYALPEAIGYIGVDSWNRLSVEGMHPYGIADLLVLHLMKVSKTNFYEALAAYFQQASSNREDTVIFEEAFGISVDEYNRISGQWLNQLKKEETYLDAVAHRDPTVNDDLQFAFELSQKVLKEQFKDNLRSHQRVVAAEDKERYISALCQEFGMLRDEAEKVSQDATWRFSIGTTVIEMSSYSNREKRIYRMGNIIMKKYLSQAADSVLSSGCLWFRNGVSDYFASFLVEQAGLNSLESTRQTLLETLRKAERLPVLEELQTAKEWDKAVETYGREVVQSYAALAGWYLWESQENESILRWLNATKNTRKVKEAFEKELKITLKEYQESFDKHLQSLKPQEGK